MITEALFSTEIDVFLDPLYVQLQNMLSDAHTKGQGVALMMVHSAAIDKVDARFGINSGNKLSSKISSVLRMKVLRKCDEIKILARDEFACILPAVSSDVIARLAAQRVINNLDSSPIEFGQASELADVSVGIAFFPEHGLDAEKLLQCAKQAMLAARSRTDRIWIYKTEDAGSSVDQSRYAIKLRKAIEQNSLTLHFMPQARIQTGQITGAEVLLRWTDEELGYVPPYALVQVAESCGLIDRLTQWVITSAVQQCVEFQSIAPDFTVSVNISPSNLHEPDLPLFIDRALRTWGVKHSNLIVEITESVMIADPLAANLVLGELKAHGMQLSIDDFGTGYSSMYYLAQLPLDELKIDQSFVRNMLDVPSNGKIVRSLIDLAHNFGLSVVAEGVETEEIMTELELLGCDYAQGHHIGQAVSAADLISRLRCQVNSE